MPDAGEATMRRVLALGLVCAVVLCAAELALLTLVVRMIGLFPTVALVLLTSVLGAFALRREGILGWRRFQATMAEGRPPGRAAVDGLLGLVAALMLLAPGFFTDAMGLVLFLPPVRAVVGGAAPRLLGRWVAPRAAADLFGPRRVRMRRGTPQNTTQPTASVCGLGDSDPATVVEGEIVDMPSHSDR